MFFKLNSGKCWQGIE